MILTVDIWDTVLRRSCHPNLIKRLTAQHLLLCHGAAIRPAMRKAEKLFQARRRVERQLGRKRLRRGFDFEFELNEVMTEWVEEVGELTATECTQLASVLADWEWAREKTLSSLDAGILAVLQQWRQRGARTYFVSDFYMSTHRLDALLRHHGVGHCFDGGITSADIKLNKRSGRLFQWVQRSWRREEETHVHIGDDVHADVAVPRRLGIDAIHYAPPAEHRRRLEREQAFNQSRQDPLFGLSASARPTQSPATIMAARLAPLFLGFSLFLYEQACASRAERVFFVSREGPFLERLFRSVAQRHPLGARFLTTVIPCSRVSTFGSSLTRWDIEEIRSLLKKVPEQTPATFCRSLGISIAGMRAILHELGLSEDMRFHRADQSALFSKWVTHPETRRVAEAALASPRGLLDRLLDQHDWPNDLPRAAVADVGWFGSMQENLARVRAHTDTVGVYLGIKQPGEADRPGQRRLGYIFDTRAAASAVDPYLDIAPPIEILCSTNDPSVTSYALDDNGRVMPVVSGPRRASARDWKLIRDFQHAVLESIEGYVTSSSFGSVTAADLEPIARRSWREFIKNPVSEFATLFFRSPLFEEYGIRGPADLPSFGRPDTAGSTEAEMGRWLRVLKELRMLPWPQGFANSQLCSSAARGFLKLTLPVAYGVRRLRNEIAVRREAPARGYPAQPSGAH